MRRMISILMLLIWCLPDSRLLPSYKTVKIYNQELWVITIYPNVVVVVDVSPFRWWLIITLLLFSLSAVGSYHHYYIHHLILWNITWYMSRDSPPDDDSSYPLEFTDQNLELLQLLDQIYYYCHFMRVSLKAIKVYLLMKYAFSSFLL